jgi:serine/threonine-protein kinase
MTTLAGRTLGRYQLLASLGVGGMAEVYRATDTRLGRTVAVKVVLPAYAGEPQFRERFLREARLVAALEHANVLPVYDFGEQDGQPYLVMPFVERGSLAERLDGGPQPPAAVARWIADLAAALDAAHAADVLHRDVKPSNVLLDKSERALLADFGIAQAAGASTRLTATGSVVGTPAYMAPELAQGDPASPASDRYALAVLAYELLAGRPPFEGDNALSVLHQHVTRPMPPVSQRAGGLPATLDPFFEAALAKRPADRPATCGLMAEELEGLLRPTAAAFATDLSPERVASVPERGLGSLQTVPAGGAPAVRPPRAASAVSSPSGSLAPPAGPGGREAPTLLRAQRSVPGSPSSAMTVLTPTAPRAGRGIWRALLGAAAVLVAGLAGLAILRLGPPGPDGPSPAGSAPGLAGGSQPRGPIQGGAQEQAPPGPEGQGATAGAGTARGEEAAPEAALAGEPDEAQSGFSAASADEESSSPGTVLGRAFPADSSPPEGGSESLAPDLDGEAEGSRPRAPPLRPAAASPGRRPEPAPEAQGAWPAGRGRPGPFPRRRDAQGGSGLAPRADRALRLVESLREPGPANADRFRLLEERAGSALARNPQDPVARALQGYARGGLAYTRGDDAAARQVLDLGSELAGLPDFLLAVGPLWVLNERSAAGPLADWELAVAFCDARGEGLAAVNEHLAGHPEDPRAHFGRAFLHHLHGRRLEAIDDARWTHRWALAHDPGKAPALAVFLAEEHAALGRDAEALGWYREAVAAGGKEAAAVALRAGRLAEGKLQDLEAAAEMYGLACQAGSALGCRRAEGLTARR